MGGKSQQLQIRVTPAQKAALKRAARQAGLDVSAYVLARVLPPARARVLDILKVLRDGDDHRFALADLNDLLTTLPSAHLTDLVADLRLEGLSPFLQNYVAAMVEEAAYQKGVAPPSWPSRIAPLDTPYFAVPFPSLRSHLLRAAPVPFKRRNLFVDASIGDRV